MYNGNIWDGIALAAAIFLGIPALFTVVFYAIHRHYDRIMREEADRAYWRSQGVVPPAWDTTA